MDTVDIHKVVVHTFFMGDVEDPEIYAAEPLMDWQNTDSGKFVMTNAVDKPVYHYSPCNFGFQFVITAELESKKLSEFYLRWGKHGKQ